VQGLRCGFHGSVRENFHKGERILISAVSVNETMNEAAPAPNRERIGAALPFLVQQFSLIVRKGFV
jgi:hypothetical protein